AVRGLDQRAGLDQAADAQVRARTHVLFGELARAIEEDDAVAQRVKREARGEGDDAKRDADQSKPPSLPRHVSSPVRALWRARRDRAWPPRCRPAPRALWRAPP